MCIHSIKKRFRQLLLPVVVLLFGVTKATTQELFHQDIFNGGVTVAGYSTGVNTVGNSEIELHIPPGSSIRNAWMFMYSLGEPPNTFLTLNNQQIYHDDFTLLKEVEHVHYPHLYPFRFYVQDIRHIIDSEISNYTVELDASSWGPELNWGWWAPVLYVEYDHPDLDVVTTAVYYNDLDFDGNEDYLFTAMNPINTDYPVGVGLMTDRICGSLTAGSRLAINGSPRGVFHGYNDNSLSSCAGIRGHFYYEDRTLFGLDTAIPDDSVRRDDALIDIKDLIDNNTTSYDMNIRVNTWNPATRLNIYQLFPHAYVSSCDTFATNITADTSICEGESLVLSVGGGSSYEWLGEGWDAPENPEQEVAPTSNSAFRVRVTDSLGCSKVEQVLVNVRKRPRIDSVMITSATCGSPDGAVFIQAQGVAPLTYQLGDSTKIDNGNFPAFYGGDHSFRLISENGCFIDTMLTVPDTLGVNALFAHLPEYGQPPLEVFTNNLSTGATDYIWQIDQEDWDIAEQTILYFDESGNYEVDLIAYNNSPDCADTFRVIIPVYDTLYIRIPNVFTPNGDGVNDRFTINIAAATHLEAVIINRWGNTIVQQEQSLNLNNGEETIELWNGNTSNGSPVSDGVYFYKIIATDLLGNQKIFSGNIQLVR